jgi:GLPGLI family protein
MSIRLITMLALVMLTVTGALADDHAELSVTYEVVAQQVEEVKRKDKDLMRLDIGEHASQFRSVIIEWVLDNGLIYGSPTSLNHPFKGYTWLEYQVVKNLPKAGYLYFTHGRISTRDKINGLFEWQLLKGDTVICGYPCKKAKTKFRGRIWTVWYTPLLPYSDGPWKFCGLPGLVLEAHEAEGKLAFHCKKIEKDTGYGIVLIKQNASPMLRKGSGLLDVYRPERAHELMMLEKYDPEAFFMEMHGELRSLKVVGNGKVYKNGKEMKTRHHTAILYEK